MPLVEFQKRYSKLQKLGIGNPMSFCTKPIDINVGQVNTPTYSYPEIITCVSSIVGVLTHPSTNIVELTSISVLKTPTPLKNLIEFLENMDVSNNDDRISAIIFLKNLYWSITPKV